MNLLIGTQLEEKNKKILVLCPYPLGIAPGQRFRFEHYLGLLEKAGINYEVQTFLDEATNKVLYKPKNYLKKITGVLLGFFRRFRLLFSLSRFDYIYVFREVSPLGPPIFEWLIAKVWKKKIIYDFDDAIWISNTTGTNKIVARIKWHQKVAKICSWAYKVSVGNAYLGNFAKQYNQQVFLLPTVVNTSTEHNKIQNHTNKVNIGWTGSHSTLFYLEMILPVLKRLETQYDFNFYVIADKNPALPLKSFKFIKWNKQTEIDDLLNFHIGLMPLHNEEWSKGKCGFKAIQYMALGIPPIVSPVGMNTTLVEHEKDGFICHTLEEWETTLRFLLDNHQHRMKLGKDARKKIIEAYSVLSTQESFIALFN